MGQMTRRMMSRPISVQRIGERARAVQRQMREDEERPAPGGRTRRPVEEPLMMGGRRERSLMKQRLGS